MTPTTTRLLGGEVEAALALSALPPSVDPRGIGLGLAAAAGVTAARLALLQVWTDFRVATDRSMRQALTNLTPADVALVAVLPAVAEEAMFRWGLIPATWPDARGALVAAAVFGILHRDSNRNWAFAAWSGGVGGVYGALFLATGSVVPCMVAHGVANLASAAYWKAAMADTSK